MNTKYYRILFILILTGINFYIPDLQAGEKKITKDTKKWIGSYTDNRSSGTLKIEVKERDRRISGNWSLNTGSSGIISGSISKDKKSVNFILEKTVSRTCPGSFTGIAELTEEGIKGSYSGGDCRGSVKNGSFELQALEEKESERK